MEKYDHTIVCRDVFGRAGVTGVNLNQEGRAIVVTPGTGGSYDVDQLDELIGVLTAIRAQMNPTPPRNRRR
ncbi:MAG: hypothetical protein HOV94_41210 [Saccharothrix sp.]|nr:hypothetical protein [Saccharothrix sp.]